MSKQIAKIIPSGKTLITADVSKVKKTKALLHGGLYYSFGDISKGYPLELYMTLLPEIRGYSMAFVRDIDKEVWLGVFIGSPRRTVVLSNDSFTDHLRRYSHTVGGRIAIVNDIVEDEIEVDFVAVEKEPKLIDPKERLRLFVKAGTSALVAGSVLFGLAYAKKRIESKIADIQSSSIVAETSKPTENSAALKKPLPLDTIQEEVIYQLKHSKDEKMPIITGGVLTWQ